jgi:hypothetical protein
MPDGRRRTQILIPYQFILKNMKNICMNGLSVDIYETKARYDLRVTFKVKDKETVHQKIENTVEYLTAEGFLDNQHEKEEILRVTGFATK